MKLLERAYPWLLGSPVVLPLVIWSGFIYPYLVPKTLLFYALSLVTFAVFVLLVAYGHSFYWSRLKRKELWIPGALLVLAYIASIFGIDFYHSFWSIFVRGDGLLMLAGTVVGFYLLLLYADRIFLNWLVRAIAAVGTIVALYGIGEWLFAGGRVGSLLGNAAFFAGYLGVALFATLLAGNAAPREWQRWIYSGAVLQIVAIILSATRGTIMALGTAAVVAVLYIAWGRRGTARTIAVSALGVGVVLLGLFFAFRSELAHVAFQPIARIASIGTADSDVSSRLFIWKNMLGEIEQHPLLGVGAEHVDVLFNHFYDPTQISEEWFDRSHNAFLDYAAQYGVFGLLLYLALIGSFAVVAKRLWVHGDIRAAELAILAAITYAVQNFFVFDTISSFWLLLTLLALFASRADQESRRTAWTLPNSATYLAWPVAVGLILLIFPVSLQPAIAAYDLAHAYLYQLTDVSKETSYLSHGIALGTYGDLEYGYESYDMYTGTQAIKLTGAPREAAYHAAVSILTDNFNRYPYDARTSLYLAHVLSLAPPEVGVDTQLLSKSLNRTVALSPKRAQSWYIQLNIVLTEANTHPPLSPERVAGYAKAKEILTEYLKLVPTLSEPHFVLAELERSSGDSTSAAAEAALGKTYYRPDTEAARRAAGYYEAVKDWSDAEFFLNEIVARVPTDTASRYDLAKVAFLSGDYFTAESIVSLLQTEQPEFLKTDPAFLAAFMAYEQSKH